MDQVEKKELEQKEIECSICYETCETNDASKLCQYTACEKFICSNCKSSLYMPVDECCFFCKKILSKDPMTLSFPDMPNMIYTPLPRSPNKTKHETECPDYLPLPLLFLIFILFLGILYFSGVIGIILHIMITNSLSITAQQYHIGHSLYRYFAFDFSPPRLFLKDHGFVNTTMFIENDKPIKQKILPVLFKETQFNVTRHLEKEMPNYDKWVWDFGVTCQFRDHIVPWYIDFVKQFYSIPPYNYPNIHKTEQIELLLHKRMRLDDIPVPNKNLQREYMFWGDYRFWKKDYWAKMDVIPVVDAGDIIKDALDDEIITHFETVLQNAYYLNKTGDYIDFEHVSWPEFMSPSINAFKNVLSEKFLHLSCSTHFHHFVIKPVFSYEDES